MKHLSHFRGAFYSSLRGTKQSMYFFPDCFVPRNDGTTANDGTTVFRQSKIFLFVLLLLLFCQCFGQGIVSKIDKNDLSVFIKTLSSVQFDGRAIDNYGQIKTQDFIIDRFKALHLEPFSPDGYLEKFNLIQTNKGAIYMKTQNNRILHNSDRMIFEDAIPQNKEIAGEVVFGGNGTEAELSRIDVANRFVLIPSVGTKEKTDIMKRLEDRNACGLIMFHKDDKDFETEKKNTIDFYYPKRYSMPVQHNVDHPASPAPSFPIINTLIIPGSEVTNIINIPLKKLISPATMRKFYKTPPSVVRLNFEDAEKTIETANVIGVIRGESDKSILLSAHYDHIGTGDNIYYPGADDNASGVAALLELAEEFVQYRNLKYSMIFLATSAEESGLLGSRYHVEKQDFDPEKILCNINMDMIARCDNKHTADCDYLYYIGAGQPETLDSLVRKADMLYPYCKFDSFENDFEIFARTDGYNFRKKGIPSILFFAGFHDDYHKPTDTIDKIDFDILKNRVRLICEVIKLMQEVQ